MAKQVIKIGNVEITEQVEFLDAKTMPAPKHKRVAGIRDATLTFTKPDVERSGTLFQRDDGSWYAIMDNGEVVEVDFEEDAND